MKMFFLTVQLYKQSLLYSHMWILVVISNMNQFHEGCSYVYIWGRKI